MGTSSARGVAHVLISFTEAATGRPNAISCTKDWARSIKRDLLAIYLAAPDPRTPWYAKALAVCVAGYALSPIDLIPDFIPVIGYRRRGDRAAWHFGSGEDDPARGHGREGRRRSGG